MYTIYYIDSIYSPVAFSAFLNGREHLIAKFTNKYYFY